MKKTILFLLFAFFVALSSNAACLYYGQAYYWECSFAPDPYTGEMQFLRGDGKSQINIMPDTDEPEYIIEGKTQYNLDYHGKKDGWRVYKTQYPLIEVWINSKYVMIVSYFGKQINYMARFNPKKGVISGTKDDINRYNFNQGNSSSGSRSSSSSRECAGCRGTGKCTGCAGIGKYVGDGYGGSQVYICPVCNGSGRCRVCYGRGYIR